VSTVTRRENMLVELQNVRQIEGEGTRRWFRDPYFDLIIWYADDGTLTGFQLCYDKQGQERAFTWRRGHSCQHERIDTGETPGQSKMSPVIVADGSFPRGDVAERFLAESAHIDPHIARLVYDVVRGQSYRLTAESAHAM
jgi:hypothetical protein